MASNRGSRCSSSEASQMFDQYIDAGNYSCIMQDDGIHVILRYTQAYKATVIKATKEMCVQFN